MPRGRKNVVSEQEIGSTGVYLANVSGKVEIDPSDLWKGNKKKKFILEISKNDPYVSAWINSKEAIACKPDWDVLPSDSKDEKAIEYAKLIKGMLFKDMNLSFNDFLINAFTMSEYGFALAEIVWKKRAGKNSNPNKSSIYNDGLFGIAKLSPRYQNSIVEWDINDQGDIKTVTQATNTRDIKIPYNKLLHFKMKSYNENPEGESVLRGCFMPYWYKKNIQRIQTETFERGFGGFIEIACPSKYLIKDPITNSPSELAKKLESFIKNLKQGKESGLLRPALKDFETILHEGKSGTGLNPDTMIDRYNTEIVLVLLADSFLGKQKVYQANEGGSTKTNIFKSFLGMLFEEVKEQINKKLIPQIFEVNGLDQEYMPYLEYGNLDDLDLTAISWFIQSVGRNCGPLLTNTYELNNYLQKKFLGKLSPIPSEEEYEKCQARGEINSINNLNYPAIQEPDYLNLDGKKGNTMGDLTKPEEQNQDSGTKPKGNYGGVVR